MQGFDVKWYMQNNTHGHNTFSTGLYIQGNMVFRILHWPYYTIPGISKVIVTTGKWGFFQTTMGLKSFYLVTHWMTIYSYQKTLIWSKRFVETNFISTNASKTDTSTLSLLYQAHTFFGVANHQTPCSLKLFSLAPISRNSLLWLPFFHCSDRIC